MSQNTWRPHATRGIAGIPLRRHLELIGRRKPRRSQGDHEVTPPGPPPPPVALVHNAWTGVKTFTTCGKAFASRDDALRYRDRMALFQTSQAVAVEVSRATACGPECLPCAYGMYGTCAATRHSSVHALRVAQQLSATARAAYAEELPTATVFAPHHSAMAAPLNASAAHALDHDETFAHAMNLVRRDVLERSAL